MYRQGDVLLIPITDDEIEITGYESKAKQHRRAGIKGLVLAEGEATGHHHRVIQRSRPRVTARIRTGRVKASRENARILTVPKGGAELVHDEHNTIKLPPGKFLVQRQREFVAPSPAARKRNQPQSRPVWD